MAVNYREITGREIPARIARNWKLWVSFVAAFVALGIAAAFIWNHLGTAEGRGEAAPLDFLQLEDIKMSGSYFSDCLVSLEDATQKLYTYVSTVSGDDSIGLDQKETLTDLLDGIEKYQEETLRDLRRTMNMPDTVYIPQESYENAVKDYEIICRDTRRTVTQAASAYQLLQTMNPPTSTDEGTVEAYRNLLQLAAQYGDLQYKLEQYENILDRLVNDRTTVLSDGRWMQEMMDDAVEGYEQLSDQVYDVVNTVAQTNHFFVTTGVDDTGFVTTLHHTNRSVSKEETFMAFVCVFTLVGVCAGTFLCLCKEPKGKSRDDGTQ